MLRRLIIRVLAIVGVICTVAVGVVTNLLNEDSSSLIFWAKSNIWWVLLTLAFVSVTVVALAEIFSPSEYRLNSDPRTSKPLYRSIIGIFTILFLLFTGYVGIVANLIVVDESIVNHWINANIWWVLLTLVLVSILLLLLRNLSTRSEHRTETNLRSSQSLAEGQREIRAQRRITTIVELMLSQHTNRDIKVFAGLLSTLTLYLFLAPVINWLIVGALTVWLVMLAVSWCVVTYRIKYGFYGTSPHEAREILTYIINHSDPTDFTHGGGSLRALFPDTHPYPEPGADIDGVLEGSR